MRVLCVSYFFPPDNLISSLRMGKWAKYLPTFGVEPWVLTTDGSSLATDKTLPVEISESHINRVAMRNFYMNSKLYQIVWNWFSRYSHVRFPDRALPWVPLAIQTGSKTMQEVEFDAIISSHGPPSSHLVASVLSRRFQVPWIADYRDLWTQNHILTKKAIQQNFETIVERVVIRRASRLITVSEPLAEELRRLHQKPVEVIPNGFDETDFPAEVDSPDPSGLHFVYTGGIYQGKRDPSLFFAGLALLREKDPELAARVQIHFIGAKEELLKQIVAKYGVESHVAFHSRCSNAEALKWQRSADALLLLEWDDQRAKGVYTGKLFEYLGAGRPIIATGCAGGVIDELLNQTESGVLVNDVIDVVKFIKKCWDKKIITGSTRLLNGNDKLQPFTRRYQAGQVAKLLKDVLK